MASTAWHRNVSRPNCFFIFFWGNNSPRPLPSASNANPAHLRMRDRMGRVRAGNFAWNLGQAIFDLKNWVYLLAIALTVSGSTLFMAFFPTRLDRNPQNQVGRLAS